MRYLGGHLGSAVSALVDGALDDAATERAWAHVLGCAPCRQAVEREGWVKRQLATMSPDEPPNHLLGSLYDLDGPPAPGDADRLEESWAAVGEIERRGRSRRRTGIALVGAGSVSVAVLGFASLGGGTLGIGGAPGSAPTASLTRPTGTTTPTTAVIAPTVRVHGRVDLRRGSDGAQRNAVDLRRD